MIWSDKHTRVHSLGHKEPRFKIMTRFYLRPSCPLIGRLIQQPMDQVGVMGPVGIGVEKTAPGQSWRTGPL